MKFWLEKAVKALALVLFFGFASTNCALERSKWVKIKGDKLIWDAQGGSCDQIALTRGTLSINCQRIDLKKSDSPQDSYRLLFSKGVELISAPSAFHLFLPMGREGHWTLKTSDIEAIWAKDVGWQRIELPSKVHLEAQRSQESGDKEPGGRLALARLHLSADRFFWARPWQIGGDRCRVSGRFANALASSEQFSCSAEQVRGDSLAKKIAITPLTTLVLPCGEVHHRGCISLSSRGSESANPLRWINCPLKVQGCGATWGRFILPGRIQSLAFDWPLGFEYGTPTHQLRFFGQREERASLTIAERARTAQLFAESGTLTRLLEAAQNQLRAQFFSDVQLICKDKDPHDLNIERQEHQIRADRLACYWPKRQLIFASLQDRLVRYINESKNLNITAPLLQVDCPANEPLRISGRGTVRASLKTAPLALKSPTVASENGN